MRGGRLLIGLLAPVLAAQALAQAQSTQQGQQGQQGTGDFYGLGRAIAKDRIRIRIGPVRTTHPEMGAGSVEPPPLDPGAARLAGA